MFDALLQLGFFSLKAVLSVVLIAAGAAKLADIHSFMSTLAGLGLMAWPDNILRMLTLIISLTELGLGLLLSIGIWSEVVNLAVLILFCLFSIITFVALRKRSGVSCRCFGALSDSQFSIKGLIRSFFLIGLSGLVVISDTIYHLKEPQELGLGFLLVIGYIILAVAFAQAAKTLAAIKENSTHE